MKEKFKVQLNEEQKTAKKLILENQIVIITGRAGCLGAGTKVLMYDGYFKNAEDVVVGDQLMGIDSTPRNVLELFTGQDQMYIVKQKRGMDYRVNSNHTLSLKRVESEVYHRITVDGKRSLDYTRPPIHEKKTTTVNLTIEQYMSVKRKKQYKGYVSPCIEFPQKDLPVDPYYMGLWLGDGDKSNFRIITTSDFEIENYLIDLGARKLPAKYKWSLPTSESINNIVKDLFGVTNVSKIEEKVVPDIYKYSSKEQRISLLAGMLDSDGHYSKIGKYYELTLKDKKLAYDIVFISRSLGYKTSVKPKIATMRRKDGSVYSCEVHRIIIVPEELIPCKIERKKNEIGSEFKDQTHTGVVIEKDTVDWYYGFRLDGDNLFILEDFTVTHNCGKSLVSAQTAIDLLQRRQVTQILVTRATIEVGASMGYLPGGMDDKFNPYLEAFAENVSKCSDKIAPELIKAYPVQFIRGKTIDDILIVEEAQNLTKAQMLAVLTRLGKNGKIVINGDNEQKDIKDEYNGLSYAIELSKKIEGIEWIKLKQNHRSDLVGQILEYEYK
jgi:hypothetical protein